MQKRIYGLDIMRAVAILLIVYAHLMQYFGFGSYDMLYFGDGVSMFFVLSGYLIGRILLRHDKSLTHFWCRRWLRTLPAYFFVIIVLMIYEHRLQLQYFFFTQALLKDKADFYAESWSLCVEEWFYLLIPILFLLRNKLFWILFIIVAVSVLRVYNTHTGESLHEWDVTVRKAVVMRLDNIMYGVLAAYISLNLPALWKRLEKLFPIGLALWLAVISVYNTFGYGWFFIWLDIPLQAIAYFMMIPYLSNMKSGSGVVFRTITFFSIISYSMYLLNLTPVYAILGNDYVQSFTLKYQWLQWVIYLVVTFFGAYLLNRFIEKPFMNLRDGSVNRYKGLNKIDEESDFIAIRAKAVARET
jgi:peptidoglycan/LPS O-acetylase OafA/YrhL